MDQDRFDDLARLLGARGTRRAGVRAALGSVVAGVGLLAGGAFADEATARRRRRRCDPACPTGQTCDKATRTCRCDNGGTVCGVDCCLIGQRCDGGQCVEQPEPGQCLAFGEPCKDVGRRCCENLQCASGQGGQDDVACWVRKTGRCASTAECVYGTECVDGACIAPVPPPPGPACTVCASGCPHATIEAAIRAAAPGAVIAIAPGTYDPEPMGPDGYLEISRPMTLKPCGSGTVTVNCPIHFDPIVGDCVHVSATGAVALEDLDIVGAGDTKGAPLRGIRPVSAVSLAVTRCRLSAFNLGIFNAIAAAQVTVAGGTLTGNGGVGNGLITEDGGTITCSAPPVITAFGDKCEGVSDPTCDCQD